jgi:hypothetical protein
MVICKMTMTGFADLMIPINTFQVFKRRNGTIGVQVTTRRFDLSRAIAERANNGHLVISVGAGLPEYILAAPTEIATAKVTRIRIDEGVQNKSITIQAKSN